MRRSLFILITGFFLAVAAYAGLYFIVTAKYHSMEKSPEPEIAWLKREFHLSDSEFERICQMHDSYMSGCAERCRQIDEKNEELRKLLAETNAVTPKVEKALADAALLRAQCQKQMLNHFFEVSRTMPPDQGRRYLAWVQNQTILGDSHQQMHHH
jgi:hypothetical protein